MEDERQEGSTQEVPQGREVGDGAVVRVDPSGPHTVNDHAGQVEQQPDLGRTFSSRNHRSEGGREGRLPAPQQLRGREPGTGLREERSPLPVRDQWLC